MTLSRTFSVQYVESTNMIYFLDRAVPSTGPRHSYAIVWLNGDTWLNDQQYILADVIVDILLRQSRSIGRLELLVRTGLTTEQAYQLYYKHINNCKVY